MKRLKEEWRRLEVPAEVLEEARGAAWNRLHRTRASGFPWFAAAAAVLLGVALVLIWSRSTTPVAVEAPLASLPLEVPDRQTVSWVREPELATGPSEPTRASFEGNRVSRPETAAPRNEQDVPRRLVLNFALPESGVRVVWIKQEDFELKTGGTE